MEGGRRDTPALKALTPRPSLEQIHWITAEIIKDDVRLIKKMGMCISQDFGCYSLVEIGERYGLQGAAVSQSNRRMRQKIEEDRRFRKIMREVQNKLKMLNVET